MQTIHRRSSTESRRKDDYALDERWLLKTAPSSVQTAHSPTNKFYISAFSFIHGSHSAANYTKGCIPSLMVHINAKCSFNYLLNNWQ